MAKKTKTIGVDFKQILEDITYTNKMFKVHGGMGIVTRCQYYSLKDKIIEWLISNDFTEHCVNGFEYIPSSDIFLVKLEIRYCGTVCLVHQNLEGRIATILHLPGRVKDKVEYVPETYDIEKDEQGFKEAIDRLRIFRLQIMRERFDNNGFWNMYTTNTYSKDPWMQNYKQFLPCDGVVRILIVDKNQLDDAEN